MNEQEEIKYQFGTDVFVPFRNVEKNGKLNPEFKQWIDKNIGTNPAIYHPYTISDNYNKMDHYKQFDYAITYEQNSYRIWINDKSKAMLMKCTWG